MAIDCALNYRTTTELIALLAARQISAVELCEHAIERIEALDKPVNAVAVRDFERAREAAKAADAALSRGERRALLGIPMMVKEAYNVAGLPTTWGIPACKDWRPEQDAVAVARVKAAGAIILGKTNIALSLNDWQCSNPLYGTTNNPWDLARTPGGSSGGSAAALAAGYVSLELGSDIGGSLRTPAHFCGVFAHKPSFGLVVTRGHSRPNAAALPVENDLAVIGPMARSAADLALALGVVAGPDEETNAIAYRLALPPPRHDAIKNFRVLVINSHPLIPTAQAVSAALDALAERLADSGAKVSRASPLLPDLAEAARIGTLLMSAFVGAFFPIDLFRQLEDAARSLSAEDESLAAIRIRASVLSHRDWVAADIARVRLRQQWRDLFREWDVVLCPPMPTPAFPHDREPDQGMRHIDIDGKPYPYRDQAVWPSLATVAGLPATAMPIDRSEAGLPIGVQIIGPFLEDLTTIRFADLMEREFGGFTPPPKFTI